MQEEKKIFATTPEGKEVVAWAGMWYEATSLDGVKVPGSFYGAGWPEGEEFVDPPQDMSFWDAVKDKNDRAAVSEYMFYHHGPKGPNGDRLPWVNIDINGYADRDIKMEKKPAQALYENLLSWHENGKGATTFAYCNYVYRTDGCLRGVGFLPRPHNPTRPPHCPFALVFDSTSQRWCDCYTFFVEGICFVDILPYFAETRSFLDEINFKTWLTGYLSFLEKVKSTEKGA